MSDFSEASASVQSQDDILISAAAKKEIDQWLKKYPADQKRSALLMALRVVQEEHGGWLTNAHMDAVAQYLKLPEIAVYEVATFYKMYNLQPVGKHRIAVCNNISCMLNGSEDVIKHLEDRLGIQHGETTADGCFTLKETECLAACVQAPVLQINDKDYYENLTPEKIDALLEKLKNKEASHE
ncbi:MAG: dehydrogenase [Gammaproteobacteria bacterium]|jgi:NADH-quinone oxidoreductase subunit E|nr:dehydrogenase [Gammaproteobacteria bacterium]